MGLIDGSIEGLADPNEWIETLGATFNKSLQVRESKLGGFGIFASAGSDAELLRVPRSSTLSIYTCMVIIDSGKGENAEFCRNLIKRSLKFYCTGRPAESRILVCYCVSMLALSRLGKLRGLPLADFLPGYLDVLLNTQVDNSSFDNLQLLEDYKDEFPGNALVNSVFLDLTSGEDKEFADYINEEAPGSGITAKEVRQLISAIRSRILEIPRELEDEEDGFVTDVTLVPMLDFANHDNAQKNAHFDVDRKTKDVLLKTEAKGKDSEIFISYSAVEDVARFYFNYGFIPTSQNNWKLFEVPFWGYYLDDSRIPADVSDVLYAMGESPNVQFCVQYSEKGNIKDVQLNMLDNYSFLVLAEGIEWEKYVHPEGEPDPSIVEALMETVTEEQINKALYTMVSLLNDYMKEYAQKVSNFVKVSEEYDYQEGETRNILNLAGFGRAVAERFTELYPTRIDPSDVESVFEMILSEECIENWTGMRLCPVYNFRAVKVAPLSDLTLGSA